ncbi:hypothetical protein [Sciscionella sediminilitoris]|uniref:hypothetical protein n=1 Tax=Sciscionella sediminilitoris TaxID=1445613 RepID=UPI0004DEEAA0|nr:hypothetical protein [Sciscionella sp. SE31]
MAVVDESAVDIARRKANALRALADMIEEHPEIRVAYLDQTYGLDIWCSRSAKELAAIARAALKHGATVAKDVRGDMFNVAVSWHGMKFKALGKRSEVCERVKVGEETVTEMVPDPKALAKVPRIELTKTVDRYEWRCAPLLASDGVA